jgi:hypothetical protein
MTQPSFFNLTLKVVAPNLLSKDSMTYFVSNSVNKNAH